MNKIKVGVCIVTCGDRPEHLKKCIETVGNSLTPYELVVVNNGTLTCDGLNCEVLSGGRGNSPHGQNIGLRYLAKKGCTVILKSDDDLVYEEGYLDRLVETLRYNWKGVAAVGGICWSDTHSETVSYNKKDNNWYTQQGVSISGEGLGLYRVVNSPKLWEMRHLHGAFLYKVEQALELEERTKEIRGGAFGEYFSQIACREETEFTLLLSQLLNQKLLYNTSAVTFHQYAPGGTRNIYTNEMCLGDDAKMRDICKRLNMKPILSPVWIKPYGN